jgi:hypothetical protein
MNLYKYKIFLKSRNIVRGYQLVYIIKRELCELVYPPACDQVRGGGQRNQDEQLSLLAQNSNLTQNLN